MKKTGIKTPIKEGGTGEDESMRSSKRSERFGIGLGYVNYMETKLIV